MANPMDPWTAARLTLRDAAQALTRDQSASGVVVSVLPGVSARKALWVGGGSAVLLLLVLLGLQGMGEQGPTAVTTPLAAALREWQQWCGVWQQASPLMAWLAFVLVFAGLSAASLPGCALLAVAAGGWWGFWAASLSITLASAAGAMVPFWAARRWGQPALRARYPGTLAWLDRSVTRSGPWGLLMLRLVPVVPYAVTNPLMGVSALRPATFFGVSALGMWPGSAVYAAVGAGLWRWADAAV